MATLDQHLIRGAERIPLPSAIPAILAEADARLVEISLVGTRLEHDSRVPIGATVLLDFLWRSEPIRLGAKIIECDFRLINGRRTFVSDLQFCASIFESPAPVREIISSLVERVIPPALWSRSTPARAPLIRTADDEGGSSTTPYLQCALAGDKWRKQLVWVPQQPREGFTMIPPRSDGDVDSFCRSYEAATPEIRRLIRASAELSIAQNRKP